MDTSPAPQPTT